MGRIIIKVDRDEDLYMEWSSIVDNWARVGTAAEFVEAYGEDVRPRLARADDRGSSVLDSTNGHWDEEWGLIVHNVEHRKDGAFFQLPRAKFAEYARLQNADKGAEAEELLVPLKDNE